MNQEIIIYLYSNFSKSCNEIKDKINFLSNHLKILSVNIDCKKIRNIILQSKKIKVEYVPCLLILNQNKLEVYENEQFLNATNNLYNVFTEQKRHNEEMIKKKQEQDIVEKLQQQQQQLQQQQLQQQQLQQQTLPNFENQKNLKNVTNLQDIQTNKNKIGKTKFKVDKNIHPFTEDNMILTVQRERPEKGIGHTDLAISSLPEIGLTNETRKSVSVKLPSYTQQDDEFEKDDFESNMYDEEEQYENKEDIFEIENKPTKKPVKIGKNKVEMFEDFTGLLDEDIDINQMRGAPTKNDEKTMKMNNVKKAAEQMMREREMVDKRN